MVRYGLLGFPLVHSFSRQFFTEKFRQEDINAEYLNFEIEHIDLLATILQEYPDLKGLNVTIPYKLDCMKYLDHILDDAKTFGAVNTICCKKKSGYNTDGMGFMLMLLNGGIDVKGKKVLVLGSGGVGRSVIKKLMEEEAEVYAFDLNQEGLQSVYNEFKGFTPLSELKLDHYDCIINCTGVGMHKTVGKSPIGEEFFKGAEAAVDLIYEPKESEFLRLARINGLKTLNGEAMLFYQAYYADCYFLDLKMDSKLAKNLFLEFQKI
jgi:shikimate dehydrogenase